MLSSFITRIALCLALALVTLLCACAPARTTGPAGSARRYLGPKAPVPRRGISYRLASRPTFIVGVVLRRRWSKSGLSY